MEELTCSFNINIKPSFILALDGSAESARLHKVANEITQSYADIRLYFLGDTQEYPSYILRDNSVDWQKRYEKQVRIIAPIIESLRRNDLMNEQIIILSSQPIIDLDDWIQNLNCILLGESQPLVMSENLFEVDQHLYSDWREILAGIQKDDVDQVRIGNQSCLPYWWDNEAYAWHEDRWELRADIKDTKSWQSAIQLVGLSPSGELPRATLIYKDGRKKSLAAKKLVSKSTSSTKEVRLSDEDVKIFQQAVAGESFRCAYHECPRVHKPTDLQCMPKNQPMMIYKSLHNEWFSKKGFIVFQKDRGAKVTARLENSVRLPDGGLLLANPRSLLKYHYDKQRQCWVSEEIEAKQFYPLVNDQFAIYWDWSRDQ